jgi:hypothetical protein
VSNIQFLPQKCTWQGLFFKTKSFFIMRNLLLFMFLVGIFVVWRGKNGCNVHFGPGISGTGNVRTETRNVGQFHGVDMSASAEVEVIVADQFNVEVSGYENILPILKTEVKNGILHIFFDANVNNTGDLKIKVSAPNYDHFGVAGSGNVRVTTALKAEKLTLAIAGSGNLYLPQAELGSVECDVAGSGGIQLGGSANDVEADVVGSGNLDAQSMSIRHLDADVAGSGSVTANVTERLDANITGSGDIRYSGDPQVNSSTAGSGEIRRL